MGVSTIRFRLIYITYTAPERPDERVYINDGTCLSGWLNRLTLQMNDGVVASFTIDSQPAGLDGTKIQLGVVEVLDD